MGLANEFRFSVDGFERVEIGSSCWARYRDFEHVAAGHPADIDVVVIIDCPRVFRKDAFYLKAGFGED